MGGWLRAGAKWNILWMSLGKEEQPEAFARLHFGPLRQRVDWIHRSALDDL
jgi:hypothetical protein